MSGARRSARPPRVSLATLLGGDIDGAWWPRTGSLAAELPDLIAALHRPLGEIVDICVNWSATTGAPDLRSMSHGAALTLFKTDKMQRLMVVAGKQASAKLLVVPHLTSPALGLLVMRRAAALPIPDAEHNSQLFLTADHVVRSAEAESASWAAQALSGPGPSDG
jgi:hypothetical protein